jgi:hypothetical protein
MRVRSAATGTAFAWSTVKLFDRRPARLFGNVASFATFSPHRKFA